MAFLDVLWKSLILYVLLTVLSRLIGKKLLSQTNFFDFVTGVTIGSGWDFRRGRGQRGMDLLSTIILTAAVLGTRHWSLSSIRFSKTVVGEPWW